MRPPALAAVRETLGKSKPVIPLIAGIEFARQNSWIPAIKGMTRNA
jgi:hypothetical protein